MLRKFLNKKEKNNQKLVKNTKIKILNGGKHPSKK